MFSNIYCSGASCSCSHNSVQVLLAKIKASDLCMHGYAHSHYCAHAHTHKHTHTHIHVHRQTILSITGFLSHRSLYQGFQQSTRVKFCFIEYLRWTSESLEYILSDTSSESWRSTETMETQRILMRSLAVVVFASVIWTITGKVLKSVCILLYLMEWCGILRFTLFF